VLTAESIYPDWPRLIVLLVLFLVLGGTIVMRSRRSRPIVVEPEPPATPPQV